MAEDVHDVEAAEALSPSAEALQIVSRVKPEDSDLVGRFRDVHVAVESRIRRTI